MVPTTSFPGLFSAAFFHFFDFLFSALLLGNSVLAFSIPPNSVPFVFVRNVPQEPNFLLTDRLVFGVTTGTPS